MGSHVGAAGDPSALGGFGGAALPPEVCQASHLIRLDSLAPALLLAFAQHQNLGQKLAGRLVGRERFVLLCLPVGNVFLCGRDGRGQHGLGGLEDMGGVFEEDEEGAGEGVRDWRGENGACAIFETEVLELHLNVALGCPTLKILLFVRYLVSAFLGVLVAGQQLGERDLQLSVQRIVLYSRIIRK